MNATIPESLRAFLSGLVDYAGLFPPARLDLAVALRNHLNHRHGDDAWMLGRFIVPAGRLTELPPLLPSSGEGARPLRLSVLVGGGADIGSAADTLAADLRRVQNLVDEHGDRVTVEALETRLPETVAQSADPDQTARAVDAILERVGGAGLAALDLAVESPGPAAFAKRDAPAIAELGAARRAGLPPQVDRLAYKLRCGGVDAEAVPDLRRVAAVLTACRDRGVAFKATAGLHHPLRGPAPELPVVMHGFVNLFGAGFLAHGAGLDDSDVAACLDERAPAAFVFDEGGFAWRDRRVDTATVQRLRREALLGFGSCSFDQPREELRALGLLPGLFPPAF
ncbi:MAG: hypothetical protein R6X25_06120 [Candidatus Krumholzibacteriia bacterium]